MNMTTMKRTGRLIAAAMRRGREKSRPLSPTLSPLARGAGAGAAARALALVATIAAAAVPATASAQTVEPGFALNRFSPSAPGSDWFSLESLDLQGHGRVALGLLGDYARKPLAL